MDPSRERNAPPPAATSSVEVFFSKSNRTCAWTPDGPSLLELAENLGLDPAYGCRSGMCGSCAIRVVSGEIEYARPTLHDPEPGTALICKAIPRAASSDAGIAPRRLVLDL